MQDPITNSQLNTMCLEAITKSMHRDNYLSAVFLSLYNTGLRCNELLNFSSWHIVNPELYTVQLSKRGVPRTIERTALHPIIQENIATQSDNKLYNYRAIEYSCHQYFPDIITVSNENCRSTHLFRYNFMRKLYSQGLTVEEIQAIICHQSRPVTYEYLFKPLVFKHL